MNKILLAFLSCILFYGCGDVVREEDSRAYSLIHDPQFQDVLNKYGAKCDTIFNVGLNADMNSVLYELRIKIEKKHY